MPCWLYSLTGLLCIGGHGQILLIITLFQKESSKMLTFLGFGGIAILLLLMFVIGIISMNYKILLSTVPFLVIGVLVILHHRKKKSSTA